MIRKVLLCMLSLLLLVGCAAGTTTPHDNGLPTAPPSATLPNVDDDTEARIAYYEQLVSDLQREILEMKTELYVTRVEYEARIAELEAGKAPEDTRPEDRPSVSSQFTYVIQNGSAVITAYTGNEREIIVPSTLDGYPVRVISDRAFADQIRLISVTLPEGITSIGWFAFSGCIALERVSIPASVSAIAYGAFENCPTALTLLCPAQSYAAQYAASYGITARSR